MSSPRDVKSEFVCSAFDVDFSPRLLPDMRFFLQVFLNLILMCGCIIHTRDAIIFQPVFNPSSDRSAWNAFSRLRESGLGHLSAVAS